MPQADLPSARLWYTDQGQGPVLLLVHGFPLDSRIWSDVIPLLTPSRRVIAMDLRGFGQSEPTGPFSMPDLASDVAEFCAALGVAPCAMAGLSMGGYVLQELASAQPERISHLILLDTKAAADDTEGKNKRMAMAQLARDKGSKAVADQMMPNMVAPGVDPDAKRKLQAIMESQRIDTIAHACLAMRDRQDYVNLLPRLGMPVDIIVGEQDVISPPTLMRAMHERAKNGRYVTIPGAGHLTPMEQPHAVAEALLKLTEGC